MFIFMVFIRSEKKESKGNFSYYFFGYISVFKYLFILQMLYSFRNYY